MEENIEVQLENSREALNSFEVNETQETIQIEAGNK